MQYQNLLVEVHLIAGGEAVSRLAHQGFVTLMEKHEDYSLASYHGRNRSDQQWHLILIGPPHVFAQFQQEHERILHQACAQEISVPEESLLPFLAQYLRREAQMMATGQSFVQHHYPASSPGPKLQKKKPKKKQKQKRSRFSKKQNIRITGSLMQGQPQHESHQQHQRFGGQLTPPSTTGHGFQVLYECPGCHQVWLLDGGTRYLRLLPEEITAHARRLEADLARLPRATCRLCAATSPGGIFEVDEYAGGRGYGFNWEAADPPGAHLLMSVLSERWLVSTGGKIHPDLVRTPNKAREVLRWLGAMQPPGGTVQEITAEMSTFLAQSNPPGYGASGTENWCWRGGLFSIWCPPLEDMAVVVLAIALPPDESCPFHILLSTCQKLACMAADEGGMEGEDEETVSSPH